MSYVTMRVSEGEKTFIRDYAKMHGSSISDIVRSAFFEKVENEIDLQSVRDYEKTKGKTRTYSLDDVVKELGLENEI